VYATWTDHDGFDPEYTAELWRSIPGWAIDFANKLLKPVTNFYSTNRRLWEDIQEGTVRRDAQQAMAKWIGDNPPFPGKAFAMARVALSRRRPSERAGQHGGEE